MKKSEFIDTLSYRLRNHPDKTDIISYYYELIQDKIDAGENEDEVIASLGSIDEIIEKTLSDYEDLDLEDVKFKAEDDYNKEEAEKAKQSNTTYKGDKRHIHEYGSDVDDEIKSDRGKKEENPKKYNEEQSKKTGIIVGIVFVSIILTYFVVQACVAFSGVISGLSALSVEVPSGLIVMGGALIWFGICLIVSNALIYAIVKLAKKLKGGNK